MLTDEQKLLLIEAAEEIIREDFTSKPGWNFPCSSVRKKVMRIETPDGYEAKIYLKFKRALPKEDDDEKLQECRICGCTAENACTVNSDTDDERPCAWEEPDLCDNPDCLAAAASEKEAGL